MKRALCIVIVLTGCASTAEYKSDVRYVGRVEDTLKTTRFTGPYPLLTAFGAIGGALYATTSSAKADINVYAIKTAAGESITAQSDEEFSVGECVEVIPRKLGDKTLSYGYGDALISRATGCAAS